MSKNNSTVIKMDEQVLKYKEDLYEKTVHHLKVTIPKKIAEYQELAKSYGQNSENEQDGQTSKKRKLDSEDYVLMPIEDLIKTNRVIMETHQKFKKAYIELIETFSVIRGWISLNIPRIEDGNNFGVDVQEDIITQITKLEEVYTSLLDGSESYFASRASLVKKILKHKDIEAYRYSLAQVDEKEFTRFSFSYFDLANNYATTYSLIVKNFAKLETPRPTNASNIY
ncbi:proteasome activator complex subunit 3 [Dictyostelium discoideum AX4]|uniref:Proteasome activator 28 n=1 Tax=Dictyostelium discoideum TaxID=44689 RepID=PSME_DICDI|nr:proteasome activator complex subunit 3 [Dictyostelium discoideum AX4]Q967U1.1 RecName: Full=Proteasome activator 28; AltName: Full=PA28 homolog [Dictyostelium discoideum]AAK39562.1 proteasome regulator PA28 [Dictyostelium discoideum]EAL64862.1 proteasome activator complex subunit 3 [Dictyostelium discoideum AX4]|eukprot:XP_639877.1 proteasome activator complex subunit 3 [Dictyostelium discoideum AX4]